jgi:hypothetical protein
MPPSFLRLYPPLGATRHGHIPWGMSPQEQTTAGVRDSKTAAAGHRRRGGGVGRRVAMHLALQSTGSFTLGLEGQMIRNGQ